MTSPTATQLLELANRDYRVAGSLERAASEELGMSGTAFWAAVVRVLDDPAPEVALEFGPLLRRLERRRAAGMRQRTSTRAGWLVLPS